MKRHKLPALDYLDDHDLVYERAPEGWVDGVPMANGHLGAMLWGDGQPLHVTLDKYDVWETRAPEPNWDRFRYSVIRQLLRENRLVEIQDICSSLPKGSGDTVPYPTRLPLPRMAIDNLTFQGGRLRLKDATWETGRWRAFAHATRRLFVLQGLPADVTVRLDYAPNPGGKKVRQIQDLLNLWGYPPLERGTAGTTQWVRQAFPAGGEYVIAYRVRSCELLLSIQSSRDAANPLQAAVAAVENLPEYDSLHKEHAAWWRDFWGHSAIALPDARLENLYYAEIYKLGSSTRPDGYPIPLQGLWSVDGCQPPWWGDYHLDLNVQETYWPIYTSNHLDLGDALYERFFAMLPRFREDGRKFFDSEGAWARCALAIDGIPIVGAKPADDKYVGWVATACSPSYLAWLSHHYWLHYRYSLDAEFLRARAQPMMKAAWQLYRDLLEEGPDGKLHLPVCHSPEYAEGTPAEWQADTSYDGALIRFLCQALMEADDVLAAHDPDRSKYAEILARLYDYPGGNELWIAKDLPLTQSHRHLSHLLAIYPLGLLTIEGTEADRLLIENSLRTLRRQGMAAWAGHTYPPMSLIAARAGKAEWAWNMLQLYFAWLTPNSLHLNGDRRNFGITLFAGTAMTLEAGFGAAAAVMELLLQSWNGLIRVFPATPDFWPDVSFRDLLAEGAVLVSAEKKAGRVQWIEIESRKGGMVRIKNVFQGPAMIAGQKYSGDILEVPAKAGERIRIVPATPPAQKMEKTDRTKNWFGLKRLPRY
ncbi:MAG: hypothetical protein PHW60_08080 [Kiritimatiellae bacterium]|nr:hypothetical protein [Kiritimatiellia bacterium]